MTRSMRSLLTILLFVVTAASAAIPLTPVRAAGDDAPPTTADDNLAIAVNTTDGTVVFDVSFSLRRDADGVVDETNVAAALASCTGCTTVAFAFQAVLVTRNANVVIPQNVAIAFNDQCTECFTYASASQVVLGFSGPVRITHDGRMRLRDLRQALGELEARAAELAPGQFLAAAEAIERELISIMSEEVVRVGRRPSPRRRCRPGNHDVDTGGAAGHHQSGDDRCRTVHTDRAGVDRDLRTGTGVDATLDAGDHSDHRDPRGHGTPGRSGGAGDHRSGIRSVHG